VTPSDRDSTYHQRSGVVSREVPNGAVLVDVTTGQCWELNGTAASIWTFLEDDRSIHEISEHVVRRFRVSPNIVERDISLLIEDMTKKGLLEARLRAPPSL
jgi:hypothetical protein